MASELRRIFHLSDIHFGLENNRALDWVKQEIAEQRPDAVAITGDLTMRARHREFAAATQWINSLAAPVNPRGVTCCGSATCTRFCGYRPASRGSRPTCCSFTGADFGLMESGHHTATV